MGTIRTIETITDTLTRCSIELEPKRCSYMRNWNSKCKQCLIACQHEAISRSIGHLDIDQDACTECGACFAACPTNTMVVTSPSMTDIVAMAKQSAARNAECVLFACSRNAARFYIDTERVAALPCLNYLDEYLLVGIFSTGAERISLLSLGCEGCDIDCSEPHFDLAVRRATKVLELWGIDRKIEAVYTAPEKYVLEGDKKGSRPDVSHRREAFSQAKDSALGWLASTVNGFVGSALGEADAKKSKASQRVLVRLEDRFPPESYRSARLLKMLDYLGRRPYGATVDTPFWASIAIDPEKCRRCGMCARMCATQALSCEFYNDGTNTLRFEPSKCMGCRLCKDTCLTRSMVYSTKVLADDLDAGVVHTLYEREEPRKH